MNLTKFDYRNLAVTIEYKTIRHTYLRVRQDGLHITSNPKISQRQIEALIDKHYARLIQQLTGLAQQPQGIHPSIDLSQLPQAKELFTKLLLQRFSYFSTIGYALPKLSIKRMKSRWGSYSLKTHTIHLNLELLRYPQALIDYVVVHELCHLVHHNHGKGFYVLLGSILPNWYELKQQLNQRNIS